MTLKNNSAPLLRNIKLCVSFHRHVWIQTFDIRPWRFAGTLLLSLVITPENVVVIRWWEHNVKCMTVGQTDWTFRELLGGSWTCGSPNEYRYSLYPMYRDLNVYPIVEIFKWKGGLHHVPHRQSSPTIHGWLFIRILIISFSYLSMRATKISA